MKEPASEVSSSEAESFYSCGSKEFPNLEMLEGEVPDTTDIGTENESDNGDRSGEERNGTNSS
jgi:hypothetical protein